MKALADFNRAIELGAENGEVQYHRGRAYQALGQETRASDDFRAALTALDSEIGSGSGDSEMYLLRGRVFQSIGNHSKATSDFQTALREADAGVTQALAGRKNGIYYFRAFQSRAEVYDTLGDHGKAEEDRRWLRSFDPEERSKKPATLPPKPN
jgi:tetratricopeptide (TPR) repeat protein